MFIAKLAACILMIPHPGLYFKRSEPLPVFQIVDSGFYDACCFWKKGRQLRRFWRSTGYPSDFQRYNYHRGGGAAVFLCGEEGMKNEIEVVI